MEASVDGRAIALGGAKPRALLAMLALNAGSAVSAARLIEGLWGERPPATAGKLVQVHVSRLRKALAASGDGAQIVTRRHGYELRVAPDAVDARRFERLLAAGAAREALGLWRGPPLDDVADEPFAGAEIRRLEELRLTALEVAIERDLSEGRHREVIAELEALVAAEPLRERLQAMLMLALYRSGRQADALAAYRAAHRGYAEALGLELGPSLRELEQAILRHDPSLLEPYTTAPAPAARPAPAAGQAAPPVPATRLIGRERERQELLDLICADDARLVTLVGPGGVGKTRLTLELAGAATSRFRDGAAWVELAAVGRAEHVPGTLARALAVTPVPGETPEEALPRVLEAKELLLVIDNFEHVLEAAPLVAELLARCPSLTVLATSREALDLAAERVYPVAPLALPVRGEPLTAAAVGASPAGALFLAAAGRHDPSLRVDDANARAVAEICTRLDGLPLAIELAAAHAGLLSPESLAARLDRALGTLARGPRDAPARQRTLRATIDWSYRLLDSREQAAFARFAVFAGGATLQDAEAITGADFETLEGLARKHLLLRSPGPNGEVRLVMLETVREYARDLLDAAEGATDTPSRHWRRYFDLATTAERHLFTHAEPEWLRRLDTEIDNIRAALDWSLGCEPRLGLRLAGVLEKFWDLGHRAGEGVRWLRAALEAAGPAAPIAARARARVDLGFLTLLQREGDTVDEATAVLTLARESRDDAIIADALALLCGFSKMANVDREEIRPLAIEGLAHARRANDERLVAWALMARAGTLPPGEQAEREHHEAAAALRGVGNRWHLVPLNNTAAYMAIIDGSYADAARLLDEVLLIARESGEPRSLMAVCGNLGLVRLLTGDDAGARVAFDEQLRLCRDHNIRRWGADEGLGGLAAIAAHQEHFDRAAGLLGAATALGPVADPALMVKLEHQFFDPARAHLGDARWDDALLAGRAISFRDAIELALAAPEPLADDTASPSRHAS